MSSIARRAVAGILGTGAAALMFAAAPTASAERPPNCTAADLAGVASGVAASTSAYLFTHPEVNDFFTTLEGLDRDTIIEKQKEYFAQNPQVHSELAGIRQPLVDTKVRCGTPVEEFPLQP
jgi:hemophore-related protein